MTKFSISLVVILVCTIHISIAQNNFKITNSINLQGDDGWDYLAVDNVNQHLFVSHGTQVQVVDIATRRQLAIIPDTKGVHGIAIANDLNKGFISNGRDSSVTVFDLKTFATINKISISGKNPDAILYDSFSHRIFTFNGRSNNSTVIDAATEKEIATIKLDGKPEFAVTDKAGKIYVNIEDKSEIVTINSSTLKVERTISIAPGEEPSGLAIDVANNRLFAVCDNKMMVIVDAESGKVIDHLPIGDGVDGVAFDAATKNIFSSNGEGTLTVIHEENENTFKVVETVATQKGARTIALNPATHHLYLPTAEFESAPEKGKRRKPKPNSFMVLEVGN